MLSHRQRQARQVSASGLHGAKRSDAGCRLPTAPSLGGRHWPGNCPIRQPMALGPLPSVESELLPQQSRARVVTRIIKSRSSDRLRGMALKLVCILRERDLLERIPCFCFLSVFSGPVSSTSVLCSESVSAEYRKVPYLQCNATAAQWIPDFPSRRSTWIQLWP